MNAYHLREDIWKLPMMYLTSYLSENSQTPTRYVIKFLVKIKNEKRYFGSCAYMFVLLSHCTMIRIEIKCIFLN